MYTMNWCDTKNITIGARGVHLPIRPKRRQAKEQVSTMSNRRQLLMVKFGLGPLDTKFCINPRMQRSRPTAASLKSLIRWVSVI